MIIEDKFVISASQQDVWDFFLDIPKVSTCVPGAEKVEQVDDNTFAGTLTVKVGPIKANFSGQATLTDLTPPQSLTATAQGKDKTTSSMVSATFTATLTEIEPGQTEVAFKVDVAIRGRLGQFGQAVIRETAKQITQIFVNCVQTKITEESTNTEQSTSPSDSESSEGEEANVASASAQAQMPEPPSLISIIFKSILATIGNWFRSFRSDSRKPAE